MEKFNYAVNSNNELFKNKNDYRKYMLEKDENDKYIHWGGSPELKYFHNRYKVNILIYNTDDYTYPIINDQYKNENYKNYIYLHYTGNHYNSIIIQ